MSTPRPRTRQGARSRRATAGGTRRVLAVAALGAAGTLGLVAPAGAAPGVSATRLAGPDRYATAAAAALAAFPHGSAAAVVVSGQAFPDALSAAYLAGRLRAPILLTAPGALSASTASALAALGVAHVYVVGGTPAVSAGVQATLESDGYTVARIAGATRDVTAQDVAEVFPGSTVGSLGSGGRTAIVASDTSFPDALAASPIAYAEAYPILLTGQAALSPAASTALATLGITQVLLVGGPAAVSDHVAAQLAALGITVTRLAGADRTQTATAVADFELSRLGWTAGTAELARGDLFPDALAASPLAGQSRSPLLLTENPDRLGPYAQAWLTAHRSALAALRVLGSPAAVSTATVAAALDAAR